MAAERSRCRHRRGRPSLPSRLGPPQKYCCSRRCCSV
uniref:UORF n=1 Tax=Leishmania major TaxID=5664 RepID=Q5QHQ5_LEIMA|nr:uORF [Leishmania major]